MKSVSFPDSVGGEDVTAWDDHDNDDWIRSISLDRPAIVGAHAQNRAKSTSNAFYESLISQTHAQLSYKDGRFYYPPSPLWKFSENSSKSTNSIIPKSQFHAFSIINNSVSVKHMTQKALKTWSCGKSKSDYDRLPNDTRFGLYTSADLYKGNVTPIVRNLEQPNYNLITLHLSHNYIFQPFHIQYCNVINCPIWNK